MSASRGSIAKRSMSAAKVAAGEGTQGAAPGQSLGGPKLGNLRSFLHERVGELLKALEQKAVSDFNDWLVGCVPELAE